MVTGYKGLLRNPILEKLLGAVGTGAEHWRPGNGAVVWLSLSWGPWLLLPEGLGGTAVFCLCTLVLPWLVCLIVRGSVWWPKMATPALQSGVITPGSTVL